MFSSSAPLVTDSSARRVPARVVPFHPRAALACQRGQRRLRLAPKHGRGAAGVDVRYLWSGAAHAPTIIVQGGISAHRDVYAAEGGGWWQALVGPGRALDLGHCRILSIDWLTPEDFGAGKADAVATADQADALAALLSDLRIEQAAAFVGYSYGAMVALAFAQRHASRLGQLLLFSGAHRAHPMATAQRSIQRQIVRLGLASGQGEAALSLARQLAMTTYRGSEEFSRRFSGRPEWEDGRFQFPVERYLAHSGQRFVECFEVQRFLALSESIDLHQVDPAAIDLPATLVGVSSDRLVPLADLCELQRGLRGAVLEVLDSPYGHDAALKEAGQVAPLLRRLLSCCGGRGV